MRPSLRKLVLLAAFGAVALSGSIARASDLFRIDVNSGMIVASSNDMVDLIEALLDQRGAFAGLIGLPSYDAELDYLGVRGAVQLAASNSGSDLALTIPSIGAVVAFNAATPGDLEDQIEAWLKQNGSRTWAEFLEAMNARAPLALLDGNPRSTTALMANSAFRGFGLHDDRSRLGFREQEIARWSSFGLTVDAAVSGIDAPGFDDLRAYETSITLAGDIGRSFGVSFSLLGQLRDYQGAESYDVGIELALPLRLRRPDSRRGDAIYWAVTPVLQAAGGASGSLAAGGLFLGGGLVHSVACQSGPFEIAMGNQLVYYGGLPISDIGGYDFDTDLSRVVLKNGVKLGFHPIELVALEAGLSATNFLASDAAVDNYATPFVGAVVRFGRFVEIRAAYEADIGNDDYRAHTGRLAIALKI